MDKIKLFVKNNIYGIFSVLLVAVVVLASVMMYKNYLVEKVTGRLFNFYVKSDKDYAGMSGMDKIKIINVLKDFFSKKSLMSLHKLNTMSDSEIDAALNSSM